MAIPLLRTKLYIPPVRADPSMRRGPRLVSRPRLVERLDEGLRLGRKLTLLSAPAGFGKTTLIGEWVHRSDVPAAWLSLDKADNDPVRFLTYLAAAIQTVMPEGGSSALAMMQSPQPPGAETMLTALINDLAERPGPDEQNPPVVLALDDYHEIAAEAVHSALTFLLDHLPPQLHLVVATRVDPPWPLARLRARQEVTELRAGDLRFTPEEVVAFLNGVMGLNLSAESISLLDARTEGWIAGLQMAALSMEGRDDAVAFIRAFSGSHRFVLDYLVEEVLDRQPGEMQEFLLKTSILDRLTASLCDAVADREDSQTMLTRLERANLFLVPLDDERHWYRYHRLFADLLRSRLERLHPDQVPALHGRASTWYSERKLITPAISYALQADDIDQLERLVMPDALAAGFYGELYTLIGSIEKLPGDVVRSRPWLSIAYAWALRSAGRLDDAESSLRDVEAILGDRYAADGVEDAAGQTRHIRGHIAALRSYLTLPTAEDWDRAIDLARMALELLPQNDLRARAFVTGWLAGLLERAGDCAVAMQAMKQAVVLSRTVGDLLGTVYELSRLAGMHLVRGQLNQALATCQEAMTLTDADTRQSGYLSLAAKDAYLFAGRALYERNDLAAAEHAIRKGIELCERARTMEEAGFVYLLLARVLQATGDMDAALDEMRKAHEIDQHVPAWIGGFEAAWEALLYLQQGNLDAATRWAQESGLRFDDEVSLRTYVRHIVLARVLVAQGRSERMHTGSDRRLQEATVLLDRLVVLAESAGTVKYAIETGAVQALALYARGDLEQSLHTLERALTLAEPEGFVRTFVDEGAPMGELLEEAAARGIAPGYVSRLLAVLDKEARTATEGASPPSIVRPQLLVEPLSERELEVLRLLRSPLSLPEIADRLIVSANTVRSHAKHIYAKLDVHSRAEAVERAEELGLL